MCLVSQPCGQRMCMRHISFILPIWGDMRHRNPYLFQMSNTNNLCLYLQS